MDTREESVKNTLTGQKWIVRSLLLSHWTRGSYRPDLHHCVLCCFPLKLGLKNDILRDICISVSNVASKCACTHVDGIAALFSDTGDCTECTGGEHDFVVSDERVLVHFPKDVAPRDMVADLQRAVHRSVLSWPDVMQRTQTL